MVDFKDKIVLITGASSGIGAATAIHLASLGAKLAIVARNSTKLEEVAKNCREMGSPEVLVIVQDVSSQEGCESVMKATLQTFSGTFKGVAHKYLNSEHGIYTS